MATLIELLQHELDTRDPGLSSATKRIVLKEALQAYVLDYLYNHPAYRKLNFYGGTCLHFVYGLNRLSEDLDLDNQGGMALDRLMSDLQHMFRTRFAFDKVSVKSQHSPQGILRITLKFPALKDLGISFHADESLHLKLEVTHHKQIADIQYTPVFQHGRSFVLAHFSLETMMAGKMLACLERNFQRGDSEVFIKGRDFYDLFWFMQKGVVPLAEKLAQEGSISYSVRSAMQALRDKVQSLRISDLASDLIPLFESRVYIEAWLQGFHANFERFVQPYLL